MISFFYIYKIASGVWLFFALGALAEFFIFFFLHNRLVQHTKDYASHFGQSMTDLFARQVAPFARDIKHLYAAYCNLTVFLFFWLMGEWTLGNFRYPEEIIQITLPQILEYVSTFGSSPKLKLPELLLADDETRRLASGFIIPFMILTIVFFCETYLTLIQFPFSITRCVGPGIKEKEEKLEERSKQGSRWATLYGYYRWVAHCLVYFEAAIDPRKSGIRRRKSGIAPSEETVEPGEMRLTFWQLVMFPQWLIWAIVGILAFLMRWIYLHNPGSVAWIFLPFMRAALDRDPGKVQIDLLANTGFDVSTKGQGPLIPMRERVLILVYGVTVLLAQIMLAVHLTYLFTGNYTANACFYFALFPSPSFGLVLETWVGLLAGLSLMVLFLSYVRQPNIINTVFWFSSVLYIAILFLMVLFPFDSFLKYLGRDTQIRGALAFPVLLVLGVGSRLMLEAFHAQLVRIFEYYQLSRDNDLSSIVLHRMKGKVAAISSILLAGRSIDLVRLNNILAQFQKVQDTTSDTLVVDGMDLLQIDSERVRQLGDVSEKLRDRLDKGSSTVKELAELIDGLSYMYNAPLELESVSPLSLLNDVIREKRKKCEFTSQRVKTSNDMYDKRSLVSKKDLEEIFSDILQNSIDKYLQQQGKWSREASHGDIPKAWVSGLVIKWSLRKDKNNLVIMIEDNAGGAGEDIINRIGFPLTSTKVGGHGLALYHAQRRLARMNGEIRFQNVYAEAKDSGFQVLVTLPISH